MSKQEEIRNEQKGNAIVNKTSSYLENTTTEATMNRTSYYFKNLQLLITLLGEYPLGIF